MILSLAILLLTLAISVMDLKERRIPNKLNLLLFLAAILKASEGRAWQGPLAGAAAGFLFFLLLYLVTRGGLGEGDLKLIPSLGLLTGFPGVIDLIFLSGLLSLPVAAGCLIKTKGKARALPYAPFLCGSLYLGWFLKGGLF